MNCDPFQAVSCRCAAKSKISLSATRSLHPSTCFCTTARIAIGICSGSFANFGRDYATAVFFVLRGHLRFSSAAVAAWDAFAVLILALDWLTILMTPQRKIRELAQQQDLSRLLVFVFVVVAACAALFAVGFLISAHKN